MEIWLDTCNVEAINQANPFGIYGITTNPSLLAENNEEPEKAIQQLLDVQDGPVAVQVTVEDEQDKIIHQARALHVFSDRIIVKIPVTKQGLIAMRKLAQEDIPFMATTIFQPRQALLAALAGAHYIAPYVGRMFDAGFQAFTILRSIATIYQNYNLKTKILAAALKTPAQIIECAEIGIDATTLKSSLFLQFIEDDQNTNQSLKIFDEAWKAHPNWETSSTLF